MFDAKMVGLKNEIIKRLGAYSVEVGILVDGPEKSAVAGTKKSFHGGPARKSGKASGVSIRTVLEKFDAVYNLLYGAWARENNKDVAMVVKEMIVDMNKSTADKRRFLNAAQAVVRNPILRGDYGQNSPQTAKIKGFNRLLIDTGTMFNNIKARLVKRV